MLEDGYHFVTVADSCHDAFSCCCDQTGQNRHAKEQQTFHFDGSIMRVANIQGKKMRRLIVAFTLSPFHNVASPSQIRKHDRNGVLATFLVIAFSPLQPANSIMFRPFYISSSNTHAHSNYTNGTIRPACIIACCHWE